MRGQYEILQGDRLDELESRPEASLDIECYRNYFLTMFKEPESGRKAAIEMYQGKELDRRRIAKLMRTHRIVSFNGNGYDMLMLTLAMQGVSCEELKEASDRIIVGKLKPWQFNEIYGTSLPGFVDHIDVMEVAPGVAGLKIYGGRLHSKRLQDLPIAPDELISPSQRPLMVSYCENDLDTTADLRDALKKQIDLRIRMSSEYGIDLRSKSDAQIAEAVIKRQIEQRTGRRVSRPSIDAGATFKYRPPRYIKFQTPEMQEVMRRVLGVNFRIGHDGKVDLPDLLKDNPAIIGEGVYRMGIGGLHSSEKKVTHYSDDEYVLIDRDVTSYYPNLILRGRLAPKQLGMAFLDIYGEHVSARVRAKRAGDKEDADSRKIMVNGTFGKLGSPYSIFYSPELLIQVTLTGQLSLLMLIEAIELAGIEVVSANTDGVVSRVPRDRVDDFHMVVLDWELVTNFDTEEVVYRSLHSRDVNNYIAIDDKGGEKIKGAYAPPGLSKNPQNEICTEAVVEFLRSGASIEDTIRDCYDVRKFVTVRTVRGGAVKGDVYLGGAIRWYYACDERGTIKYRLSGNNVPRTEGAKPLMELPDEFPDDIDYDWYIREAYGILRNIGFSASDLPVMRYSDRTGEVFAHLPGAKNIHTVDVATGRAICGQFPKGWHDRWVEYSRKPRGHRECPKCVRSMGGL